ncbi:hypothetical protein NB2BOR_A17110 [Bordetella parapertussis]|nr:hypothetical protein NB2BOR_A17110 [Bordetella parapertussis]
MCSFCTHEIESNPPATDIGAAAQDGLGAHGDGLQPGRAKPVHRDAGHLDRQAGAQGSLARDVLARRSFRAAAPHDEVIDLGRLDPGAPHRVLDGVPAQGGAMGIVEGAPIGLADGRACGRYDDDIVAHAPSWP